MSDNNSQRSRTMSPTTPRRFDHRTLAWLLLVVYMIGAALLLTKLMLDGRKMLNAPVAENDLESDLRDRHAVEAFSVWLHNELDSTEGSMAGLVERRREVQKELLGPLVPVDCSVTRRICLKAENCRLFCKDASVVAFDCQKGICVERAAGDQQQSSGEQKPPSAEIDDRCDTKNGEFGLLVGYNEIGAAQWECVQLYPGWEKRERYCEQGKVELDARVREPSYRDCICPENTRRMVYRRSVLGQTVYGLPHCVPDNLVKFFTLSYEER